MHPGRVVVADAREDILEFRAVDLVTRAGRARMGGRTRRGEQVRVREHGYEDKKKWSCFFRFPISGVGRLAAPLQCTEGQSAIERAPLRRLHDRVSVPGRLKLTSARTTMV
eukprot:7378655-Prymnesium_polylepis.1